MRKKAWMSITARCARCRPPPLWNTWCRRYDITARLLGTERTQPDDIGILQVRSSTGELVRLRDVTEQSTGTGPTLIMHMNRQRGAAVFSNIDKTKPMATAVNDLEQIIKKNLAPDMSFKHVGMADAMLDAFKNIAFAPVIAVIMVYMILAAQFESFVHPFTIMFSSRSVLSAQWACSSSPANGSAFSALSALLC